MKQTELEDILLDKISQVGPFRSGRYSRMVPSILVPELMATTVGTGPNDRAGATGMNRAYQIGRWHGGRTEEQPPPPPVTC